MTEQVETAKPRKTLADLRAAYIVRLATHDEYPDWQADAAADLTKVQTDRDIHGGHETIETGLTIRKRFFVVSRAGRLGGYRGGLTHTGTHGHLATAYEVIAIDPDKRAAYIAFAVNRCSTGEARGRVQRELTPIRVGSILGMSRTFCSLRPGSVVVGGDTEAVTCKNCLKSIV